MKMGLSGCHDWHCYWCWHIKQGRDVDCCNQWNERSSRPSPSCIRPRAIFIIVYLNILTKIWTKFRSVLIESLSRINCVYHILYTLRNGEPGSLLSEPAIYLIKLYFSGHTWTSDLSIYNFLRILGTQQCWSEQEYKVAELDQPGSAAARINSFLMTRPRSPGQARASKDSVQINIHRITADDKSEIVTRSSRYRNKAANRSHKEYLIVLQFYATNDKTKLLCLV